MVLIETANWLSDVETVLAKREKLQGVTLSKLEALMLKRARETREYLRYAASSTVLPPVSPAKIDNKVGDGISQYAFAGTLGTDFPGAGAIVALNQRWVFNTMHNGSNRRALRKAGSTDFALNFIDGLSDIAAPEQRRPMMSYIVGHVSTVATHVVLHPFVNYQVWKEKKLDHFGIENQIDARLAISYFKREDLNSGQSWSYYYLNDDDQIDRLMERYLKAFEKTYKSLEPLETTCALPPASQLKAHFNALETSILKTPYEGLEATFARFPGYETTLTRFPGLEDRLKASEQNKSFQHFLDDFECRYAKLDRDFLSDGYRNTVRWVLDLGYDQSAPHFIRFLLVMGIFGMGFYVLWSVWSNTAEFSTLFGAKPDEDAEIAAENLQKWEDGGFFGNERMIYDSLSKANTASSIIFTVFSFIMTGPPIIPWKGIFGQGVPPTHWWPGFFRFLNFLIFVVGYTVLGEAFPKTTNEWWFRWFVTFLPSTAANIYGITLNVGVPSVESIDGAPFPSLKVSFDSNLEVRGVQRDKLGAEIWKAQYILAGLYFLSCMMAFSVKSTVSDANGREKKRTVFDFLLGLGMFTAIGAILVIDGVLDSFLLDRIAHVRWPKTITGYADQFLTVNTDPKIKGAFKNNGSKAFPVSLFKLGDQDAYPQDDAAAWLERTVKDEEARSKASVDSDKKDYKLNQLFERAKYFSGLLAMAAVNYDLVGAPEKERARRVFRDWNLDYRADDEWNDLMETVGQKPGLLEAVEEWWQSFNAETGEQTAVTAQPAIDRRNATVARLEEALGIGSPTHSGVIEDRSAAPQLGSEDTGHVLLAAGLDFKVVDRDGNVVTTGKIEADGKFNVTLPPGDDFELRIENYEGLKT